MVMVGVGVYWFEEQEEVSNLWMGYGVLAEWIVEVVVEHMMLVQKAFLEAKEVVEYSREGQHAILLLEVEGELGLL